MKTLMTAFALCLATSLPVTAECLDDQSFYGAGLIKTKGGGTYQYGWTVGGKAVMRGELVARPNGLPEQTFDLEQGYHIGFAEEGVARLLAYDAAKAEAAGTRLWIDFTPKGKLPEATPGKSWKGKMAVRVFAYNDGDQNRREIGSLKLEASYAFLDEMRADISKCSYRIIPVELKMTYQGDTALQRRILYFPDLGVSAITVWGPDAEGAQRKSGITAMGSGL